MLFPLLAISLVSFFLFPLWLLAHALALSYLRISSESSTSNYMITWSEVLESMILREASEGRHL